jgi:[DsrC]-trisulfide reductase subunit M
LNYVILGILPYLTIAVFVIGMIYRLRIWTKTPQPGAVTLFPAPKVGKATFFSVIKESFLFPSLFKGDKLLWLFAWFFHLTLAFIFIGHVRVITDFPWLWNALGINADKMSAISGGIAGIAITGFIILLFIRRIIVLRVREISNLSDFFALILIISILMTGNIMRFGEHFDLAITRAYFSNLVTFSVTAASMPSNGMFMLHFLLAQILIMFIPFSKILHFGGIFFTQTVIQKS